MRPDTGRRRRVLIAARLLAVIGCCLLALLACTGGSATKLKDPAPGMTAYVSVNGSGDCSQSSPCATIARAVSVAGSGGTVLLAAGTYPPQNVMPVGGVAPATQDVRVMPMPGAAVTVAQVITFAPHLHLSGFAVHGLVYVKTEADHTTLDHLHVYGTSADVVVRASHVTVENSLIEGGHAEDGINIAHQPRNHDILIRHNVVRHFSEATSQDQHADCIQLFDTTHVTIESNSLYDCYNSAITFSTGAGLGVDHVRIEGNFMQGCLSNQQRCGAGSVLDLRLPVQDTVVTHNTFGQGSVKLPLNPGVSAPANIIGYLSLLNCDTSVSDSVIVHYSLGTCKTGLPGAANGNWQAPLVFRDKTTNDLRITGPVPPPPGLPAPRTTGGAGFAGPMAAGTVGAA